VGPTLGKCIVQLERRGKRERREMKVWGGALLKVNQRSVELGSRSGW